jgi:hypothetical protein
MKNCPFSLRILNLPARFSNAVKYFFTNTWVNYPLFLIYYPILNYSFLLNLNYLFLNIYILSVLVINNDTNDSIGSFMTTHNTVIIVNFLDTIT